MKKTVQRTWNVRASRLFKTVIRRHIVEAAEIRAVTDAERVRSGTPHPAITVVTLTQYIGIPCCRLLRDNSLHHRYHDNHHQQQQPHHNLHLYSRAICSRWITEYRSVLDFSIREWEWRWSRKILTDVSSHPADGPRDREWLGVLVSCPVESELMIRPKTNLVHSTGGKDNV